MTDYIAAARRLATPCYVIDEAKLVQNLEILRAVGDGAGCRVLLAQKAFANYALYPLIGRYLDGTAASGLHEARLGYEEMGGETHVFSPAYRPEEFDELLRYAGHVVFNSFRQWELYGERALASGARAGIRVNPEFSTQEHTIYDPCAPYSRLGTVAAAFPDKLPPGISGLHFHTLCEQDSDALIATLDEVERLFGRCFHQLEWINFGGGHHITRPGYDIASLVRRIREFRAKYGLTVYLEPGEAVALDAGALVATVLDVVTNGMDIAITDASAACHMPDVLEMPYRPDVAGAGSAGEKPHTYRLAGNTCLSGDVIGDYSFDAPLRPGDRLAFGNMAIYTTVKNTTFNGMNLPSIAVLGTDGAVRTVREFGYGDFKARL